MTSARPSPSNRQATSGEGSVATHHEPDAATDDDSAVIGGHGDDGHGHREGVLGPVDWPAWGAGILGVAIGVLMALCFALATTT